MAANTPLRPASASAIPFQSDRDVVVERETDGLRQPVPGQLHQLAGGQRDGRQAQHRNVPAAVADADVERIDQPAVDLVGESDRGDELRGARLLGLGDCQTGGDIVARMAGDAPDIGVVEVEIAEGRAIGEGREIGRGSAPGADDGRAVAAATRQCHIATDANGLLLEGGETAADRIDDMHLHAFDGCVVEIVIAQTVGIGGESFRKGCLPRLR